MLRRLLQRMIEWVRFNCDILLAFVVSRGMLWAIARLSRLWIKHGDFEGTRNDTVWEILNRWDAGWYGGIAKEGYRAASIVFFPLFPLIARALHSLTGASFGLTGFAFSNLCLFAAVLVLARLIAIDFPPPSAVPAKTVWLVLFFPVSFFFSAPFTESLFLLLSTIALLGARRRDWALASVATGLLTATHPLGVMLLPALLWEAFGEHDQENRVNSSRWQSVRRSRWWLVVSPLGFLSYLAFLQIRFGNAFAFVRGERRWGRGFYYPWKAMWGTWQLPTNGYGTFIVVIALVSLIAWVLGWRVRLRKSYLCYAGAVLLLILSQTTYESVPRHLNLLFPLPMAFVIATGKIESAFWVALTVSATLFGLCTTLFVCGYWLT